MPAILFTLLSLAPLAGAQELDPSASPWGISSSASSNRTAADWFPKVSAAGVRWARLGPEWGGLERQPGQWSFDALDATLKTADQSHIRISGILFGSPRWTNQPSHAFPMQHLDAWSHYAATLAGRYKGRIDRWEVWNEGNAAFNDNHNTTADYASLVSAAYTGVKSANPQAQVGMSVASFDAPYLRQAMIAQAKSGHPDQFDYLCIHPYEVIEGVKDPFGEIPYLWMTRYLRDALQASAPNRRDADIWITEIGAPVGKLWSADDSAKVAVKAYVMAIAQGIQRTMWFEGQDPVGEQAGFGLLDKSGTPRPALTAFKTMTTCLGPAPKPLGWLALGKDGKGYGFVFDGSTVPVLAAWMPAGASDTITFPGSVQVINALTGAATNLKANEALTLTDTPLFILDLPPDLTARARASARKNYPWGGDYSQAQTVSIQFGLTTTESGLFHRAEKSTRPHQFPDGSAGLEITNNRVGSFVVHPSFASFTTTDYYIRLTLRRIAPGNVGMNFAYEVADSQGKSPMHHTPGWYSLPEGLQWQSHTWHVTDACFSKMWGYDFAFLPEKTVPFVIGKVEVSTKPFAN